MKFIITIVMGLLGFIATSQTFVSTTPENKKVILEEFTGIYCTYCPDGHLIAQNLHNANPNDVFLINIHTGGYSNPNGPNDPDFNCLYGNTIATNANIAGYPAGTVNRAIFSGIAPQNPGGTAMSRSDWGTASNNILSQPSYVNVGVQASYDMGTGILTVNTETYYTSTTSNVNALHVAVVQNNVPGPQTGASSFNPGAIITGPWSPTYNHQHMFRHLMDGQLGLEFTTTTAGTFIPNTHTWQVPLNLSNGQNTTGYFPDLDPTNFDVVAYITEGPPNVGEIITGFQASVIPIFPNAYDANVTNSTANSVVCDNQTDITITFKNYGNQPLTSLDLIHDINGTTYPIINWTGNLTSGAQETVTLNSVTFTPQANNLVTWTVSNPNGQVDQNTINNSLTSTFTHFDLNGDVINGINAGTINIDIFTDNYGNETTWDIKAEDGTTIASGGPYSNNTQYNETAFVGGNECFTFSLYDSYGDGICCANGVGMATVTDQSGNEIFEGNPNNLTNFSELSTYFSTSSISGNSWECTPFGCADVGIGVGTYATQYDCESDSSNVNTPCFMITHVIEEDGVRWYSNTSYDILGRELLEIPSGKMYIKNGVIYINKE